MCPKIVIIGSLSHGDYEVVAPKRVRENYHNEEGYQLACKRFYPAIDEADIVIVYGELGEHTQRDLDYAVSRGKRIVNIEALERRLAEAEKQIKEDNFTIIEMAKTLREDGDRLRAASEVIKKIGTPTIRKTRIGGKFADKFGDVREVCFAIQLWIELEAALGEVE